MAIVVAMAISQNQTTGGGRAESAWRWVCRLAGAILLGLMVAEKGFEGPVGLYFLFAGLMTLGDVIAEAMRLRREIAELRSQDDDR